MTLSKDLLEILACPETKEPVHLAEQELIDQLNARIEKGEVNNRGGKVLTGLICVRHNTNPPKLDVLSA